MRGRGAVFSQSLNILKALAIVSDTIQLVKKENPYEAGSPEQKNQWGREGQTTMESALGLGPQNSD